MDHVAIMKRSWGLTEKILSGQKTIESRWYKLKCRPWSKITRGDLVYFKDSGKPISIKAKVSKVIQFQSLTPTRVAYILKRYGRDIGIEKKRTPEFLQRFIDKKYCILVFLKDIQSVNPFEIDKRGFGMMSAWISIDGISRIKL